MDREKINLSCDNNISLLFIQTNKQNAENKTESPKRFKKKKEKRMKIDR